MGSFTVRRTASAFVGAGTTQKRYAADASCVTVSVSAISGTSSNVGKQPSCTCCMRHTSSSFTGFMRSGSWKSATGGSLNAIWPFSPMPITTMSTG